MSLVRVQSEEPFSPNDPLYALLPDLHFPGVVQYYCHAYQMNLMLLLELIGEHSCYIYELPIFHVNIFSFP
jgi:hypothetical protein